MDGYIDWSVKIKKLEINHQIERIKSIQQRLRDSSDSDEESVTAKIAKFKSARNFYEEELPDVEQKVNSAIDELED